MVLQSCHDLRKTSLVMEQGNGMKGKGLELCDIHICVHV